LPDRPPIASDVARAVLIEAGHRCAVCGVPCPLERAHIVPWSKRKSHERDNLICLCSNCHQRADFEGWGEKTLREYKLNPWVFRQNHAAPQTAARKRIEMIIDMEIENFDDHQENILKHALAGLLRIPPKSIVIRQKKEGSVRILMDLPALEADKLLDKFKTQSPDLDAHLSTFKVIDIREPRQQERSSISSLVLRLLPAEASFASVMMGGSIPVQAGIGGSLSFQGLEPKIQVALRRYQIPSEDAEDLIQELQTATISEKELAKEIKNKCIAYWRKRRDGLYIDIDRAVIELLREASGPERSELLKDLYNVLDSLPPRCANLLRLRYGLSSIFEPETRAPQERDPDNYLDRKLRRCLAALTYEMILRGFSSLNTRSE
jgi:hypothetical protein